MYNIYPGCCLYSFKDGPNNSVIKLGTLFSKFVIFPTVLAISEINAQLGSGNTFLFLKLNIYTKLSAHFVSLL